MKQEVTKKLLFKKATNPNINYECSVIATHLNLPVVSGPCVNHNHQAHQI
jgi:hypothetical protein